MVARGRAAWPLGIALHAVDRTRRVVPVPGGGASTWAGAPAAGRRPSSRCATWPTTTSGRATSRGRAPRPRGAASCAEERAPRRVPPRRRRATPAWPRRVAARGDLEAAREDADRGVELARRGRAAHGDALLGAGARAEVALAARRRATRRAPATPRDAGAARPAPDPATTTCSRMLAAGRGAWPRRRPGDGGAGGGRRPDRARAGGAAAPDRATARLREIAAELYVSHNTVKTQIAPIYRKLGVATREDAVARARERGLLPRSLSR